MAAGLSPLFTGRQRAVRDRWWHLRNRRRLRNRWRHLRWHLLNGHRLPNRRLGGLGTLRRRDGSPLLNRNDRHLRLRRLLLCRRVELDFQLPFTAGTSDAFSDHVDGNAKLCTASTNSNVTHLLFASSPSKKQDSAETGNRLVTAIPRIAKVV